MNAWHKRLTQSFDTEPSEPAAPFHKLGLIKYFSPVARLP